MNFIFKKEGTRFQKLNKMETKMKAKNLLGFFLIASVLLLATVSAAWSGDLVDTSKNPLIEINGVDVADNPALIAGETVTIKVAFTALKDDTSVRLKAELEGEKDSVNAVSDAFDVEAGNRYVKIVTLKVPYELKNEVSDNVNLNIKVDGKDYKSEVDYSLRVQRPSYNVGFMSVNTPQTIDAGDNIPVDVVLRNIGYNDLSDVFLTVKIPALNVERKAFVGDLTALEPENNDDNKDRTASVRINLEVPSNAEAGLYALEVEASSDDFTLTDTKQVSINNEYGSNVLATGQKKSFAVGGEGIYNLLVVNPTDKIQVYRIMVESEGISSTLSEDVVAVPAGESKAVSLTAIAGSEGEYQIKVSVFSGDELTGQTTLQASVQSGAANAVIILTIVLAIIFVVLLIVLIVLLRKKPEKEEFGESYY